MTTQAQYIAAARAAGMIVGDDGRGPFGTSCWCGEHGVIQPFALTSGMLSQSGLTFFDAAKCLDGSVGQGWGTNSAVPGARLTIDLGVARRPNFIRFRSATKPYAGTYAVEWSDNGSSWTAVDDFLGSGVMVNHFYQEIKGTGINQIILDFPGAPSTAHFHIQGAHRYWSLRLTNTPGAGPGLGQLEMWGSQ